MRKLALVPFSILAASPAFAAASADITQATENATAVSDHMATLATAGSGMAATAVGIALVLGAAGLAFRIVRRGVGGR